MISDVVIDDDGTLLLQDGTLNTDPITVDSGGNIAGYGTITGGETVNGTITADGGTLDITGDVDGTGVATFTDGATLLLEGTVAATASIVFNAPGETLDLGANPKVNAAISGFAAGDAIALEDQQVTSAVYDPGTHTLAVSGSGGSTYTLSFTGTYQQSDFPVVDGEVEIACFQAGTRILTERGEVPVEELVIGDLVHANGAGLTPIT